MNSLRCTMFLAAVAVTVAWTPVLQAADARFALPVSDHRPGLAADMQGADRGMLRFSMDDGTTGEDHGAEETISPFLAGFMSAVVPGSGQLAMGSRRGWVYLGVETLSWFGVWALRGAGNQAEDDFQDFADDHWAWDRYTTVSECGTGLGPRDFDSERSILEDLFNNSRDSFYEDIGALDVYACGWDEQSNRSEFRSMRDRSNNLLRSARAFTTVAFLNHIVSAIDAAKSASNRRRDARALNLDVHTAPGGSLAMRVTLSREF